MQSDGLLSPFVYCITFFVNSYKKVNIPSVALSEICRRLFRVFFPFLPEVLFSTIEHYLLQLNTKTTIVLKGSPTNVCVSRNEEKVFLDHTPSITSLSQGAKKCIISFISVLGTYRGVFD